MIALARQILAALVLSAAAGFVLAGERDAAHSDFDAAVAAYQSDDYAAASTGFAELAENLVSPELFSNTGSAAFRIGDLGKAALWYRRALVLDSHQSEAAQNLRYLKRRLGFLRFEATPMEQYAGFLRTPMWRSLFALCGGAAAVSLVTLVFVRLSPVFRSCLLWGFGIGIVLGSAAGVGLWAKNSQRPLLSLHVVTAADAIALAAPGDSAGRVVVLPPGTEVSHLERRGAWLYVEIPGNSRGWIRASQLDPLWPYSIRLAE